MASAVGESKRAPAWRAELSLFFQLTARSATRGVARRGGGSGPAQQSHMFGISTVLGSDSLPELSTATIVNLLMPFSSAYTIVDV